MIYNIKRGSTILASVHPTGTQQREAMGVDIVDMAFTLPVYIDFKINDWVEVYGRRYQINVTPSVEKKAKRRFDYNIQFEAVFYDLAKVQLQFLNPQNELLEPVFSLMGNAATIVSLIVENANRHSSGWTVGVVDDTDYQNFSFNAQNCLQALNQLADTFSTEFWIDNKTIHLQKRELSSGVTFEYGKGNGLYNIKRSNKSNANITTRLYVRGGSTNLPSGYGANSLLLPGGATYIENVAKVNLYGLIENTQIFTDIFPKREGTVSGVVAGAGNWKYFTDSSMDFNVNDQLAPGLEAKVTFNTGQLAGYTFTISNYNHATKTFTINKNTDEKALDIPSDLLRPAVGDKYVLIDIIMPNSYVIAAQNKLLAAAQAYYDQNSDPKFLLEYAASCDRMFIKQNNIDVQLGNTAILYDGDMGLNVELRIASYKRDLQDENNYTDVVWSDTIGANEIIRQYAQQQRTLQLLESSGLLDVEQMRKNLFLNRLSESEGYLMLSGQKIKAGVSDYAWDADKWDGNQFADFINQPVRTTDDVRVKSLTSTAYVSGAFGSGFKIDENGNAVFDNLTVRKEFNVYELVLNKISGTNGALAVSDTIKIDTVTETATGYDCTIDTGGNTVTVPFEIDDLLRCQVWNGTSVKYYFAKVTAVGNGTFTLDKATKAGAGIPEAGDTVVRFGNVTDANRRGLLYLTASDGNAPYLDVLDGITSDNLAGKTKVRLGRLDGITDADFGNLTGYGLYGENVYLRNGKFKGEVTVTGGNAETTTGAAAKAAAAQAAAILAAANDATNKVDTLAGTLKSLAYQDVVELAKLGTTVVQGGKIKTTLLDAAWIQANVVTAQYINTLQIDAKAVNIQIGGRNYLTMAMHKNGWYGNDVGYGVINYYSDYFRLTTGNSVGIFRGLNLPSQLAGETVVVSFDAYCNNNGDGMYIYLYGNQGYANGFSLTTSWKRYSFIVPNVGAGNLIVITNLIGNRYYYFKNFKIEIGNKPTDWTPSPDDYGSLAYENLVELSKLGTTVIEGGYIKTSLLDANYIKSNIINASYIQALNIVATNIQATTGTIAGFSISGNQIKGDVNGGSSWGVMEITSGSSPSIVLRNKVTVGGGTVLTTIGCQFDGWGATVLNLSIKNLPTISNTSGYKQLYIDPTSGQLYRLA